MFLTRLLCKGEPFRAVNTLENHHICQFFPNRCKIEMKTRPGNIVSSKSIFSPHYENKGISFKFSELSRTEIYGNHYKAM